MNPTPPPEEDSADLIEEEILGALPSSQIGDILAVIRAFRCPSCGGGTRLAKHAIRRRKPHLYWRVTFVCSASHESRQTFCADWIKGGVS